MSRLPPLDRAQMTPEQRAVADAITSGPRGGGGGGAATGTIGGPCRPWLMSPSFGALAQRMGAYCRFETSLPGSLSEMVILLTGKHWRSQYEFWAHSRLAREAGLPAETIEAIRVGGEPPLHSEAERATYALVQEYFADRRVSDAVYQRAVAAIGERGVLDVVAIIGYYSLVSATLNVFDVSLPEGQTPPLA